jgi:small subunit ribosomal protein S11
MARQRRGAKRKERKNVPHGIIHIKSSFNNTIVTVTDLEGQVLVWTSGGSLGFKGSRKGTPFAAQQAALRAATLARDQFNMRSCSVWVKGPGSGRESAVRAVHSAGVDIREIRDVSPIPHNGCRPPKRRRV